MRNKVIKLLIYLILLLTATDCFAQTRKDTIPKTAPLKNDIKNQKIEKQELLPINADKAIGSLHFYKIMSEIEYSKDFRKPLLKDVIEQNIKTDQEVIAENMKGILADVRKANEDKRSSFLKTVQSALGIAQAAVVTALAVNEVVKEIKNKSKK